MPKKSTPARGGVQRSKPKTQKSFELVRPTSQVQELEDEAIVTYPEATTTGTSETPIEASSSTDLDALPTVPKKRVRSSNLATEVAPAKPASTKETKRVVEETVEPAEAVETPVATVPKGSAAARLAANKTAQRTRRSNATLITAEHYSYVRRDLIFIAVLAAIMFAALIVIYFTGLAA